MGASAFVLGGEELHARLAREAPGLVRTVLAEIERRVAGYGVLPAEQLAGDITRVTEQNLRAFIELLRTRELPSERELAFLRESAARRAEEGIPIEVVLTAYHVGVQTVWEFVTPFVRPEEVEQVMAVNALVLRYLEVVTPAVGAGYLDERRRMLDDEGSARHTVLGVLLGGGDAAAAARQAGVRLPERYLVLALGLGRHADEGRDGVDPVVAGRRKLRRVRSELGRRAGEGVLSALTPEGGTALVPVSREPGPGWVGELVSAVARVAGAEVTAGWAVAGPEQVASAAQTAQEVLRVAGAFGRPPGVYRLADVLLEYQMSRPGEALDGLARLLAPLDGSPELEQTLEVYLRRGGRRPTASELHVHPNTVDYRLRRVLELTGLDATRISEIGLIKAALAARVSRRRA